MAPEAVRGDGLPAGLTSDSVLLVVGGGIAAYKAADLCSKLSQGGFVVRVVMTASATKFVGQATFAALSGRPVASGVWDPTHPLGPHIELTDGIAAMIVAPATANLLFGFAQGRADDLATTAYLQNRSPVLLAPAMSDAMWNQPSVQRNVRALRADGCHLVGPEEGWLSCRKRGTGRMSEPATILRSLRGLLAETHRR